MREVLMNESFLKLVDQVEDNLKGVPHLPEGIIKPLLKVIPWLALIGGIFNITGSFSNISFGLGNSVYNSEWMTYFTGIPREYFLLTGILSLISGVLMLMAFKPLKEMQYYGWVISAWNVTLSLIGMVIGLLMSVGGVGTALFSGALSVYLLFEFKSSYTKK